MNETSLSAVARKTRRQVLGLLLGSSFLGRFALAQKKAATVVNTNPPHIIIDEDGTIAAGLQPHVKLSAKERLLLVNLSNDRYTFHFEKAHFDSNYLCVDVAPLTVIPVPPKFNPNQPKSNWHRCLNMTCPGDCPPTKDGGDIIIVQ
jgi:hypothetical protein